MTKQTPEFVACIVATKRLRNSRNGNPRFIIAFDNGEMRETSSDAACSYDVDNYTPRHGGAPLLEVFTTKTGRVSWFRKVDES